LPTPSPSYNPSTGVGSVGVEFATPSITSANFDEAVGAAATAQFEVAINNPIPVPGFGSVVYNPHLKYVDLDRHGYFVLDLKGDSAQADYFYIDTLRISTNKETFNRGVATANNSNRITSIGTTQATGKSVQVTPAPLNPPNKITGLSKIQPANAIVITAYPNPTHETLTLNYALNRSAQTEVQLFDIRGVKVKSVQLGNQPQGIFSSKMDVSSLDNGIYFYHFLANGDVVHYGKFVKQ